MSAVAPAMLVSEIETQKQAQGSARPPIVAAAGPFGAEKRDQRRGKRRRGGWGFVSKGEGFVGLSLRWLQIGLVAGGFVTVCVTNGFGQESAARKAAAADPLLKAMQTEMDRERELLVLPGMQKPYFIEYRLDDFSTYDAVGQLRGVDAGRA